MEWIISIVVFIIFAITTFNIGVRYGGGLGYIAAFVLVAAVGIFGLGFGSSHLVRAISDDRPNYTMPGCIEKCGSAEEISAFGPHVCDCVQP